MSERLFRVRVHVQGVGFRWWTCSLARRLGITGTVRNHADGSVEVRARGSDEALATLRTSLQSGPPGAVVSSIDEGPSTDTPTHGFEIVH